MFAGGTFVAATVCGGDGKVFSGSPRTDGGVYVFCSLYTLRQYVFRVISIYGVGIGAVKYIGRSVLSVIVGGWAPTDFPISFGLFFDAELRGGGWRNIVYPRHGRLQGGSGVVAFFKNVIKFLRIVHEVLHTVVTFACQTMCTGEVYLPLYFVYRPVAFIGVEEVDAQSGNNLPSVTLFLPVECKG